MAGEGNVVKQNGGGRSSKKGTMRSAIKVAKGTRDFHPREMRIRTQAFDLIRQVFSRHGAVTIDTPVFELRKLLQNKYGEDSKLIYDLADHSGVSGEKLSLRYDLTVPFARYVANYNVRTMKRYHIGKVYRRDRPAMEKGRFREFYQCDMDIAGEYPSMVADAEVLFVFCEILDTLASISKWHKELMGSFKVKMNHRGILDAIFVICGVDKENLRAVSSSIDKLDKEPWEDVKKELVTVKSIPEDTADRIGKYCNQAGAPYEMLKILREDSSLSSNETACASLDAMEKLFEYLDAYGVLDKMSFDLTLARGLDYYTGVIFEAIIEKNKTKVGSIGAGGRYDDLVGGFKGQKVPCVGCSLGVERIMTFMMAAETARTKEEKRVERENDTEVLVVTAGKGKEGGNMVLRMKTVAELWKAGIKAEFCYNANWDFGKQRMSADKSGIPIIVICGEEESKRGAISIKDMRINVQKELPREKLVAGVRSALRGDWNSSEKTCCNSNCC